MDINRKLTRGLVSLEILLLCFSPSAQTRRAKQKELGAFRYVIIENRVDEDENTGNKRRVVEVLLDEKVFSEPTLRELFRLLSKRFIADDVLDVTVHTSLEQAPTPEEREEGTTSGTHNPRGKLYYWAIYLRSPGDEYFRYSPTNDKSDNRLVQLSRNRRLLSYCPIGDRLKDSLVSSSAFRATRNGNARFRGSFTAAFRQCRFIAN